AADAGHRPRAADESGALADGRADRGVGAAPGAGGRTGDRKSEGRGPIDLAGRAESPDGAPSRRPRSRAVPRACRVFELAGRTVAKRRDQVAVSRTVRTT